MPVVVAPDHRIIGVNGFNSGPNIVVLKPAAPSTPVQRRWRGRRPLSNTLGKGLLLLGNGKASWPAPAGRM